MAADRMKQEWAARVLLILLALGVPLAAAAARWAAPDPATEVHGAMPEVGGWNPAQLTVQVGQPLHLRLTSDDVVHGFAVGKQDGPMIDVMPGKHNEVTLTFDEPGTYTFYCTRWCGPNHWRMRGTIQVTGMAAEASPTPPPPLFVTLNLDLDAGHSTDTVPAQQPSAARGKSLAIEIPAAYLERDVYLTQSPADVWQQLRADSALNGLSDQEVWDLVAAIWQDNWDTAALAEGQKLYVQQCAACHGETGAGDGVEMAHLDIPDRSAMNNESMAHGLQSATDFTDMGQMLSASSALLYGKTARGGMGTGMPNWGPIYTDEQIWALVDYLWTFQFPLEPASENS